MTLFANSVYVAFSNLWNLDNLKLIQNGSHKHQNYLGILFCHICPLLPVIHYHYRKMFDINKEERMKSKTPYSDGHCQDTGIYLSRHLMHLFHVTKLTLKMTNQIEYGQLQLDQIMTSYFFLGFQTTTIENEIYITRTSNESLQLCFLVRSKMNIYCADDGIWSEWSDEQCWKGMG